ncbi:polysaccharide pyruvyl transferase family protein [Propionivibrio limicola]|uniref:polysaccharide pyruvyl transferase family protein n=1 Tax=Propionivibrio limicola TaxID=167645 RepID=UPI001290FD5A|nr:polysaccharide pyruvyl transferase family protein [Propionivibrio limicola]
MRLYYYKDPDGNFGDDLNPWLWPKLIGNILDDNNEEIFVGIGTLLNQRLPASPIKHIFGSGLGYGTRPTMDSHFIVHAVRGYETAKALDLDPGLVITDAAVLIRAISHPKADRKNFRHGLMPHSDSLRNFDWEDICKDTGIRYISCRWGVERVIQEISQCDVLLAEAMHGAIIADAIRVPWIPISCYGSVLDFKWRDWLSTLDIEYFPRRLPSIYAQDRNIDAYDRFKIHIKRGLKYCGIWSDRWTPPPPKHSSVAEIDRAKEALLSIADGQTFLSDERVLNSHTCRYLDLLENFKKSRERHG